jgi:SPW repeat
VGGAALAAGNPLLAVFISVVSYFVFFALGSWLVASPWIVVGFAVFLAAGRRTGRPPRVRYAANLSERREETV